MTMSRIPDRMGSQALDLSFLNGDRELIVHRSPDEEVKDTSRAHVWFCDLDRQPLPSPSQSVLSLTEHIRIARLRTGLERQRSVARWFFVRQVLGNITSQPPESLEFRSGLCGKPALSLALSNPRHQDKPVRFNISHTESILGLAVTFGREVGIDLETVKTDLDVLALATANLPLEDVGLLRALPTSERSVEFFRLWTRREALGKMEGNGIVSQQAMKVPAITKWTCHPFEFVLGEKHVVGTLALEDY